MVSTDIFIPLAMSRKSQPENNLCCFKIILKKKIEHPTKQYQLKTFLDTIENISTLSNKNNYF